VGVFLKQTLYGLCTMPCFSYLESSVLTGKLGSLSLSHGLFTPFSSKAWHAEINKGVNAQRDEKGQARRKKNI